MFKNILSTFFTRFFIALFNLAIAIILSNFTGAAGRGEQSLIITLITFILIITSIIGSSSISYLLPRFRFMALIIPSYSWVILVIFAAFFVLPFLNMVPEVYNNDVCLLSLMLGIQNINSAVLISKQRINDANRVSLLQSFVIILVLLLYYLVLDRKTIQSYVNALYAGYGISSSIDDYSVITTDEWGVSKLVERDYVKRVNYPITVENWAMRRAFSTLAALRATPAVFIGSDDYRYTPFTVFGRVARFSVSLSFATYSIINVEVQGLSL